MVEVVSTKAHSGTSSVHMKFATAAGNTLIKTTKGFPAPMNSLWGRVWLFLMTADGSSGHDVYIETSDGTDLRSRGVRPLNTIGGNMTINVSPGIAAEDGNSSNMKMPKGAWTCFEWQIAANGTTGTGSVTLYMGGTQIAKVPNTKMEPFAIQRVGYEHYAADPTAGEMWIDDFAIGSSRINCN